MVTLFPTLRNMVTTMSEYNDSSGIVCLARATLGSCGRLSCCVWVEVKSEISGSVTVIGCVTTHMPVAGSSMRRKWCVVPESSIFESCMSLWLKLIVSNMIMAEYA